MNKGEYYMGNTEKRRPRKHRKRRMQRHKRSVLAVSAVVEDVAREKLGLIHENEIILKEK